MASNGDDDDEAAIETQLEHQIAEHKDSMSAVDEALASDPSNPDLISVQEELALAIKDAEEGLLNLKRSRLLREADTLFSRQGAESVIKNASVEPFDSKQSEPESLESETFSIGSKCRFRFTNGRWYNGQIVALEDTKLARISFLNPTSESTLMCKFFLQQRCRFANNCRFSHGYVAPMSSLKQYIPTIWQQSLVGSEVWAASSTPTGIWQKAELESWDDELRVGQVIFRHDGSTLRVKKESLALSEFAESSDSDEDSSSNSEAVYSDEEDDVDNGIGYQGGFMEATELLRGVQTETAVFAKWENHTRGIASKMMAKMGYRDGMGLGIEGQGMLNPVSVKVLPSRQSLDHAVATNEYGESTGEQRKKRSRGGKRKREKKYAEAVRAAKAEEEQTPDVFSFINNQLAGQEIVQSSGCKSRKGSDGRELSAKEDRRSLVAYDDEIKDLRYRVEKLEEMVKRNRNDKAMCEAASRKLNETRKALADVEAAHASAANAVVSKEKEKRWLKF